MKHVIKQLSIFIENRPNELANLADILSKNSINIKSIILAESSDFGIVRVITDKPQEAKEVLKENGISSSISEVFGVRIKDEVGTFSRIASILGNNNVNILYMYSFYEVQSGIFIFHVDSKDLQKAIEVLLKKGENLIESEYFTKK